ncbi:hypothetical protein FB45DRAFT_935436 [Roridomyces roridus]|uniref:F-box domain-containing protein n=1 Tax=Roridomyces roridus TaxID=1738132 RepID=A0AAD7FC98_9AGAR|nr:hypothetical protein FB45DRAFT_935436 [Roridomyces roridus]
MIPAELRTLRAQIDATIASLEEKIVHLQAQRQYVDEQLAAAVYPIQNLPREMISEIFLRYGCDELYGQPNSPLVLASVCSQWREVALGTHGLWTHFNSAPGRLLGVMRNPEGVANRLQTYISRSGTLPLDLRIHMLDSGEPSHEEIFRLLMECSARWRRLDIAPFGPVALPADIQGPFPHLVHFSLDSVLLETPIPPLLDAPNLVHLDVTEVELGTEWRLSLPWRQLTTLKVFQMDVFQCLEMMDHTPNLEQLHFACDNADETIYPARVLPHLHKLSLGPTTAHEILPHLTLPKLGELEIDTISIEKWASYFEDLITRSGCTLQKLEFFVTDLDEVYEAENLFSAIPTVRHLTINCPRLSTAAFAELFDAFSADPPVLPALESLEIKRCETRIELPPLGRLLTNRHQIEGEELLQVVDLASFKLLFRQEDDDFLPEEGDDKVNLYEKSDEMKGELGLLRELRNEGLDIEIRSDFMWFDECIDWKIVRGFLLP